MGKILSEDEWVAWDKGFFWIQHSALLPEGVSNNKALRDIMLKWCSKHGEGWVTFIDGYWMFELKSDASKLKACIITGYFDREMGDL